MGDHETIYTALLLFSDFLLHLILSYRQKSNFDADRRKFHKNYKRIYQYMQFIPIYAVAFFGVIKE